MNASADFLPVTREDILARGWEQPDFIVITGDAYVDHPSFGAAVIARVIEAKGWRVAVMAQPNTGRVSDFTSLGPPRLAFLVTGGNIDSMVAHYTAAKKRRSEDAYSPGGKAGLRPDRAVDVYCDALRRIYPDTIIITGGLEASLRRFAHYDYWADRVLPSSIFSSRADLLVYGMGERAMTEIARRLGSFADVDAREPLNTPGGRKTALQCLQGIRGTCITSDSPSGLELPAFEAVSADGGAGRRAYAAAVATEHEEHDPITGSTLCQRHGERYVVQYPPAKPLNPGELDSAAELPYTRRWHPMYDEAGGVPALAEVRFSIIHNRGCFGCCNFCSLAYHQGRTVSSRSPDSVVREAEALTKFPEFKGYIHDVGGPTANFRRTACAAQKTRGACRRKRCLFPAPCKNLEADHSEYLALLRRLRKIPGVKKVFIRSGVRFDYLLADPDDDFFRELVRHHVSGQLKVAPEHCAPSVLRRMGKPDFKTYERFEQKFRALSKETGKEQYLVPYLMSSHPGSTMIDAVRLAQYIKRSGLNPEQVQDFYPTPGTVSTCMYYTGLDPVTMEAVHIPKGRERQLQRALLQFKKPENRALVREALLACGMGRLIGNGPECLVPPAPARSASSKRRNAK